MAVGRAGGRAALGFSVHTGWAALVAVGSEPEARPSSASRAPLLVLDRRRLEMIPGGGPESPRFVYHAARELRPDAAERLVRESAARAADAAAEGLSSAVEALHARRYRVVACGLVAGGRPPPGSLDEILKSHALVHAAEGALFRGAIRGASGRLRIPVAEVRAAELRTRAAAALRIPPGDVEQHLAAVGRAAGRPWAKDHREAWLAAAIALLDRA